MENIISVNVSGNAANQDNFSVLDSHQEFNQQFWRSNYNCKDESQSLD